MPPSVPTRARIPFKAAFLTAFCALLAFGIAHAAFITWAVPDRSQDSSLFARLVQMLVSPMIVGAPFALFAAVLNAFAWRAAMGTVLRSWRYGALLASGFVPAIIVALVHGGFGDETAPGFAFPLLISAMFLVPAVIGTVVANIRVGPLIALAGLPFLVPWGAFVLASGISGWIAPFVASILIILIASGCLMERLVAAFTPREAPPVVEPVPAA